LFQTERKNTENFFANGRGNAAENCNRFSIDTRLLDMASKNLHFVWLKIKVSGTEVFCYVPL